MYDSEIHVAVTVHKTSGELVTVSRRGGKKFTVPKNWLDDNYVGEEKEETMDVIFFNDYIRYDNEKITPDPLKECFGRSIISITETDFQTKTILELLRQSNGAVVWNKNMKNVLGMPSSKFYLYMTFENRGNREKGTVLKRDMTLEYANYQFDKNDKIYIMLSQLSPESVNPAYKDTAPLPENLRL